MTVTFQKPDGGLIKCRYAKTIADTMLKAYSVGSKHMMTDGKTVVTVIKNE